MTEEQKAVPKRRGRPPKSAIQQAKKPGKPGRPEGTAGRIKEFHARLLATSGDRIIQTVIKKALDDDDKDQVACLKMCVDRLLPLSHFEKAKQGGGGINIQITSATGEVTKITNNAEEEFEDDEEVIDVESREILGCDRGD